MTLAARLPIIGFDILFPIAGEPSLQASLPRAFFTLFSQHVLSLVATGAITYGVIEELRGRPVRLVGCLSVGFTRLGPVFLVSFVSTFAIAGGFLLLVVPAVIFTCMLWVAVPASIVERPGIFGALERSYRLTDGNRWSVLGVLILLTLIGFAVTVMVRVLVPESLATWRPVALQFGGSFSESLSAVACAVGYHDLRSVKEGVSAEVLGRVFD